MNNKETIEEQLIESFDKIEFLNEEDIEKLNFYEEKLNLYERDKKLSLLVDKIKDEKLKDQIVKLLEK